MFLKKSQFTRNGKPYTYYKIVSTYKDEAGRNRHKVVKHLGKLSDEEAENVRRVLKEQGKLQVEKTEALESEAVRIASVPQETPLFVVLDAQLLTYEPYAQKEWNVTDVDMLLIVREGTGELFMNGRKVALHYGLVIYAPIGSGMHVVNTSSRDLHLDRIAFEVLKKAEWPAARGAYRQGKMPAIFQEPIQLQTPYRVLKLTKELDAVQLSGEPQEMFRRQLLFYSIMDTICRNMGEERPKETGNVIEHAVALIHQHYRNDLTRDQLAEQLGVSPEHFSRLFKKEKGMSFIDYLLHLRIEKSRELLLLSKSNVHEVAQEVGFQSQYYFSRKFKQLVGVSPSAYVHQPKKYVSLNSCLTSSLLKLGVVPRIGVLDTWMPAHYQSLLSQAEFKLIDGLDEHSTQALGELQPDLIFCNIHKQDVRKVRKLGPVAVVDLEKMDWREQLRYIADVVGKQQEAEAWLHAFDSEIAEAGRKLAQWLNPQDTFVIMKVVSGKIYVYGDLRSMGGPMIYQGLQLRPPRIVQEQIINQRILNRLVPLEKLSEYDADHVFLINYESNWLEAAESFKRHPNWKKFTAVRKNQVYEVDRGIFYGFDPLSLELQIQEIVERLSSQS
ncbi:AraC family transcriptional regulator [Paenibacillus chondroitinus]|uniref:AraC family transcriptional regulator n=1 Tax=Paenibacillus chondroitinus TaxID=59842 RepID=A0ABU6DJD2_9BACL|nr:MULTISPECIES: AraC family transcriptional regulator [Paenibacillus]MCY9657908.1 AraC family transcriptional regulator [Paenibacillus anseongense]MEB4797875.1 AraC family transcriptional regulator [Paenibacillus chondroitinus]